MKRRLFKLALLLILGVIVNVAICWVIAARRITLKEFMAEPYIHGSSDIGKVGQWNVFKYTRFGRVRLSSVWNYNSRPPIDLPVSAAAHELVPEWAKEIDNIKPSEINRFSIHAEATGLPLLAMLAHYERIAYINDSSGISYLPGQNPNGIVISPTYENDVQILPLQPIWSGFTINTILYALIAWMLWSSPFALRRILRRKPGHCIKCGYDLRHVEHEKCPECGYELSARKKS